MFFYETKRLVVKPMLSPHYSTEYSIYYALIDRKSIEEIGYICFQNLDADKGTAHLAYRTYTEFQRKGYMKEVLKGVIDTFFDVFPLVTLYIEIKSENKASLETVKCISGLIDKTKKKIINTYLNSSKKIIKEKKEEEPEYYKYIKRKGI